MSALVERDAAAVIAALGLVPDPDGGYFRDHRGAGKRAAGVKLRYHLWTLAAPRRALHRVGGDCLYFYHAGGPLRVHTLGPGGDYTAELLGPPHTFQVAVAGGRWRAIELVSGPWALISAAIVPGGAGHESADMTLRERVSPALWAILGSFVGDAT
ncbi:MAG TPA: cupin domain-containing protein [Nannocystis sp.]|jgi:hypothetical protein